VLGQIRKQTLRQHGRVLDVLGHEVRDAVPTLDACAAELGLRDAFSRHLPHDRRARQEGGRLAFHYDEIGQCG
jgi:hypothetical protein